MNRRATRVALDDAEAHCAYTFIPYSPYSFMTPSLGEHVHRAPRKLKGFFSDKTGVCALCGLGLGKRYTFEQRREHEKSYQHVHNHGVYLEAFGPAREADDQHQRAMHVKMRNDELCELAKRFQDECGATNWIDDGDATRLKAAMWDATIDSKKRERVWGILEQHKHAVQTSLHERAVAANRSEQPVTNVV